MCDSTRQLLAFRAPFLKNEETFLEGSIIEPVPTWNNLPLQSPISLHINLKHNNSHLDALNMPNAVMGNATTDKSAAGPDRCKWRRTRARESDGQASLFIRKAFHAVSNCPPHLGGSCLLEQTILMRSLRYSSISADSCLLFVQQVVGQPMGKLSL